MIYIDMSHGKRLSLLDVQGRLYPTNMPASPTPEQLAPVNVEPIIQTSRPAHEPWQQVAEADPVDLDGDGVREQQWVVKDRPLVDVQKERIDQIRRKRNSGIVQSAWIKLQDGRVVVAPISSADEMSRITALYVRAERAERKGENRTFSMTDAHGKTYALSTNQMLALGDVVLDSGQVWEAACQRHIAAVKAKTTPQSAWEYDDDLENDGWPTVV